MLVGAENFEGLCKIRKKMVCRGSSWNIPKIRKKIR